MASAMAQSSGLGVGAAAAAAVGRPASRSSRNGRGKRGGGGSASAMATFAGLKSTRDRVPGSSSVSVAEFVVQRNGLWKKANAPRTGRRGIVCVAADGPNSAGSAETCDTSSKPQLSETITKLACGLCAALTVASASPSFAANTKPARLPPLSTDPARCERAYDGNTIGQANGVSNITLDLRNCDYSNDVTKLKGKTLSSALMTAAKFDGADLSEVIMSKAYAVGASFIGTNFTNAVVDRVAFDNSDMRGVRFINTVLSGSTFEGANLEGASFEDALIGYVDIKNLCRNPTLSTINQEELGCK